mgnify:FL=1
MTQPYGRAHLSSGVSISPIKPTTQDITRISYNGLLYQRGASEVYAHIGYGSNWEQSSDYQMTRTAHGFEVSVPIIGHTDSLHVCFRDSANNWDNNHGENYTKKDKKVDAKYSLDYESEVSMRRR